MAISFSVPPRLLRLSEIYYLKLNTSYLENESSSVKKAKGRPRLPGSAPSATFNHLHRPTTRFKDMLESFSIMYNFLIGL